MNIDTLWPAQYVLLLTHSDSLVAAFTALLFEQLGICGTPGSGLCYRRRTELTRLRMRVAMAQRSWPQGRFLFDALTDNGQYVPLELTASERLHVLVCVRRPADALLEIQASAPQWTVSRAADAYCERLQWLAAVSVNLGPRALAFPTEMIIEDTNLLLTAIAAHLGLDMDFRLLLPSMRHDSRALPTRRSTTPAIDASIIGRCQAAYQHAVSELNEHCASIGLPTGAGDVSCSGLEQQPIAKPSKVRRRVPVHVQPDSVWDTSLEVVG